MPDGRPAAWGPHQSRFDARCWMLGAGALGRPRGMVWGAEEGGGFRMGTPVFWPGEFQGRYSPWGRKESDMAEQLSLSLYFSH